MKQIILYTGKGKNKVDSGEFAIVDDEYFEELNKFKWSLMKIYHCETTIKYAVRGYRINGKYTAILMHREILGLKTKEKKGDHKDGNGLNNQLVNLRVCSHAQNMANRKPKKNGASIYLGVYWSFEKNRWIAGIRVDKKQIYLGSFKDEKEAALSYNEGATIYHKEFARLNIISNER